ncbi:MAG: ABC transporter permease [Alphaproteobacteria bacterium]|nr:ABC transporter permease [Rickettsiales bacterium]
MVVKKVTFTKRLIAVFGWFNREFGRVVRLWNQVILGPFVEGILMIILFNIFASVNSYKSHGDINFISSLFGGVVAMMSTRNAFQAASSPLVIAKMIGYTTDYTALPFAVNNLRISMILSSIIRCAAITFCCLAVMPLFKVKIIHFWTLLLITSLTAINFGLIGLITGTICSTFEQSSTVNSYIITPLSMLSGTFVSIQQLPVIFHKIAPFNPFVYSVDLTRYCFTDTSFLGLGFGLAIFFIMTIVLWVIAGFFVKSFVRGRLG